MCSLKKTLEINLSLLENEVLTNEDKKIKKLDYFGVFFLNNDDLINKYC